MNSRSRICSLATIVTIIAALAMKASCAEKVAAPSAQTVPYRFVLADFEGETLPTNGDGEGYPFQYAGAGKAEARLDTDAATGRQSVAFVLDSGRVYPQFNPWNYSGAREGVTAGRGFAREYAEHPGKWQMNTFDRIAFWVKAADGAAPLAGEGRHNCEFGTYVKRVADADSGSDEAGGNHYYHFLNLPPGAWTRVILNMHPNHQRSGPGDREWGDMVHPTGEPEYNYYDAFTRFYFEFLDAPKSYPAVYRFDGFEFYREPYDEPEEEVYAVAATYIEDSNRLILVWHRNKSHDEANHEVRYSFSNIHETGWDKAMPAPDGIVAPASPGPYNGMLYQTDALPLGKRVEGAPRTLYLAIKPGDSGTFSQMALPLDLPAPALGQ